MNQLATKTYKEMRKRLLESVKIKCKKCSGKMLGIIGQAPLTILYEDTVVGYSCENCTHYYLFDNHPV